MPREIVEVDLRAFHPIDAAAHVLGVIIYPDSQVDRYRYAEATSVSVRVDAIHRRLHGSGSFKEALRSARLNADEARKVVVAGNHILWSQRWPTGTIVLSTLSRYLDELRRDRAALSILPAKLGSKENDGGSLNVSNAAEFVAWAIADRRGQKHGGNGKNFLQRGWKPSAPVLHLCAALNYAMPVLVDPDPILATLKVPTSDHLAGRQLGAFMESPDAIQTLIQMGAFLRPFCAGMFKIPEEKQVSLQTIDLKQSYFGP